jgi:4-amino-4-deoxy-L-arabinose transferase-like glycosyltransferase
MHGDLRPLTNVDPYIGALWNYLLATVFWLTGPNLYAPRALALVLGTLTVLPTYLLGRSVHGRWAGTIAACFLALSPMHAALNSHIAWSNCITPLFTTLALWLSHRAVAGERPAGLVWAGGAWGLALLTHPTAALFLPAVGLGVVAAHPRWIVTRWPWLACGAGLIACSSLIWANVQSGFAGLSDGLRVQAQYSGGATLDLTVYWHRLVSSLWLVSDSLGGGLAESGPLQGPPGLSVGLAFGLLLVLGFAVSARQRNWLLLLAFGIFLVLLPLVNARYASSVPKARYIAPLLPLSYVVVCAYLTHVYRQLGALSIGQQASSLTGLAGIANRTVGGVAAARAVLVIASLSLVLMPLLGLHAYYRRAIEDGRTNVQFYQTVAAINETLRPGERVYADRALNRLYTSSSGQMLDHLRFVGGVYPTWQVRTVDLPREPGDPVPSIAGVLVMAGGSAPMAAATMRLQEIDGMPPDGAPLRVVRVIGPRARAAKGGSPDEWRDSAGAAR